MKHPALARVFSIVLAILCLIMLINASFGFSKANSVLQDSLEKYQRLEDKTTEYESLTAQLENTISYEEAYAALEQLQSEHDSDVAQHRTDLATHTATLGGYTMAVQLINDGKVELAEAKEELAQGKAEFEAQEEQFNQLMVLYDAAAPALKLAAENASDGELEYQAALYSLDYMLYQIDTMLGKEVQPPVAPQLPDNSEGETDELSQLSYEEAYAEYETAYAEYEKEHSAWEQESQSLLETIAGDLSTVEGNIQSGNQLINEAISQIPADMLESLGNIVGGDLELGDISTMDLPQLHEYLSQARSYLAASGNLSAAVNGLVNDLDAQVTESKQAMEQAKYQIYAGEKTIEKSEQELQHQLELLWYNMGQLDDETADLESSKQKLDEETEAIAKQLVSVEEQKSLEQKQSSARVILMKEEGIKTAVNAGAELTESSRAYIQEGIETAETRYLLSCITWALAVAGGVLGLVSIPGSFEKFKSRFMLLAPTALCLACALAAEGMNIYLNNAQLYTATFVIVAAVLHLFFIIPKNKIH